MKILVIDCGTARSIKEEGVDTSTVPIIEMKYGSLGEIPTLIVNSSSPYSKQEIRDFLLRHNSYHNQLMIIRKSKGVKEIHDIMMDDYKKYFGLFGSIKDFAVDGYSFGGRWFWGFGLKRRSFKKLKSWMKHDIYNFRQENGTKKKKNGKYRGWLKGAKFKGAKEYVLDSTHMDIPGHPKLLEVLAREC